MNIYAYTLPNDATKTGLIKVGQAGNSDQRIKEQIGATRQLYEKVFDQSALAGKRTSPTTMSIDSSSKEDSNAPKENGSDALPMT